jgi:hypothetical protein
MDMERLGEAMRSEGYDISDLPGEGKGQGYRWRYRGAAGSVRIAEGGGAIRFFTTFVSGGAGFREVNAWNSNYYFSSSFVNARGFPGLNLDLDLDGGVCEGRIRNFLNTCLTADPLWRKALAK